MDLLLTKIFVFQQVQVVDLDSIKMPIENVNHAPLNVQLALVLLLAVNAQMDSLLMASIVL